MERLVDSEVNIELVCDAIIDRYHSALQDALPRVRDAMDSMSTGVASPELKMLRTAFDDIAGQIEHHLVNEQHLLFPALAALSEADRGSGRRPAMAFATVVHPIRLLEAEHARIEMAVDDLRDLVRAVIAPDGTSARCRRCMADLAKLAAELRQHHRAENEVLFPRALELEHRLL